jgi:AraC family transcriptional regulator of adaptative response/methylated-DNA-[protein]-cysteine methyltransferase
MLPPESVMLDAFLGRDASFDGIFVTAVRTTGIFCRPSCTARKPRHENISFFGSPREALLGGYRPCKRCRPMEPAGQPPEWLQALLTAVDGDPTRRWTDADIRAYGLSPGRVRRWFQRHHGMTFHAYSRARRLGSALGWMKDGAEVTRAAFDSGYDSLSGFHEAFRRYFGSNPTDTTGRSVVHVHRILTPLGPMLVGATDEALCLLEFVDRRALANQIKRIGSKLNAAFVPGANVLVERVADQVGDYFDGRRRDFHLPLAVAGTPFQKSVWKALRAIPYGETRSYKDLADSIGRPEAVRAVGNANGDNALAIVVPCHRVVGADGKLVGYGGGIWRKKRLLEMERANSA